MSDIYDEINEYRLACCEANEKVCALETENAKLKADLERALRDVDMFEKLAQEQGE
ncbi:hypothetical protein LCGC14_0895760 [marine sediment metagenome]|uniref:Uncharacterized protein n=1 Tax=marine sediment metagenome TaxID=412755 RepID=A0A0F9P2S4_9ZZZZ